MFGIMSGATVLAMAHGPLAGALGDAWNYLLVFAGFSVVIFFHELGHFLAAKWCDVKVERFAVGFGKPLMSYRKGVGFSFGSTYSRYARMVQQFVTNLRRSEGRVDDGLPPTENECIRANQSMGISETEYCFNALPLGGYVKMLGQEDFAIDKSGEIKVKEDPRAFTYKPIRQRMFIVSAGVMANLVFAAVMFMLVFMIGIEVPPPVVGMVQPDSPAEVAGLEVGDRITEINGETVREFSDIKTAILLADPALPLTIAYDRADASTGTSKRNTVAITPEVNDSQSHPLVGIAPAMNNVVAFMINDRAGDDRVVEAGDVIEEVDGVRVTTFQDIRQAVFKKRGDWVNIKVKRPAKQNGAPGETFTTRRRAHLYFRPTGEQPDQPGHLLGLTPRMKVMIVNPGEAADRAGIQAGDLLAEWDGHVAPTYKEFKQSFAENSRREIPLVVLRSNGKQYERIEKKIKPDHTGFFHTGQAKVGMDPVGQDEDHLVVADIITTGPGDMKTPAASLKGMMPLGSLITKINDEPVKSWGELYRKFIALAGTEVKIAWSYEDGPQQAATIRVPKTVGTTFDLPPDHMITRVNGQKTIEVDDGGKKKRYTADNWQAVMEVLRRNVGKTIEIEHRSLSDAKVYTEKVKVEPEMVDPWPLRAIYNTDVYTELVRAKVQELNPAKAMVIGLHKTWYFMEQVYITIKRMAYTKSIGMDQVSGPLGIVKIGSEIAEQDPIMLLYFLALISANLAVINFIPFPIVDGGLFTVLILEKIKGGPLSLRFHMVSQLIGLAVILSIFVYVTLNDIRKW